MVREPLVRRMISHSSKQTKTPDTEPIVSYTIASDASTGSAAVGNLGSSSQSLASIMYFLQAQHSSQESFQLICLFNLQKTNEDRRGNYWLLVFKVGILPGTASMCITDICYAGELNYQWSVISACSSTLCPFTRISWRTMLSMQWAPFEALYCSNFILRLKLIQGSSPVLNLNKNHVCQSACKQIVWEPRSSPASNQFLHSLTQGSAGQSILYLVQFSSSHVMQWFVIPALYHLTKH